MTARLTDVAGNAGANSTATPVTVDTVAPTATVAITAIATDSGTSSSDYVTSDTTLTVSGTHGPLGSGEKVQVSSDGGASWADVTTSTASTWSYTDPAPHATSFTYQARIVDAVGNVGANTASQAVTIDTAAPTAPSITSIAENGGGGINAGEAADGTPVVVGLSGTGAAAGDTLTVTWGGQTVTYSLLAADISANSATVTVPLATIMAQGDGTFDVTARLTDAAGNAGANSTATSVTVDTVAPTAPSITSIAENSGGGINAGEAANGTPVVLGLTGTGAVAGDTLTVNWGGQTVPYTLLAGDISANSATVTVPLATIMAQGQGTFNVTARLTDVAGNAGPNSTAISVTVDAAAPTAPVVITAIATDSGTSSSDYVTNDTTLTVSGTHGRSAPARRCRSAATAAPAGPMSPPARRAPGAISIPRPHGTSFTYQARIVDAAGNVGANTASQAVTIDTAAPAAPSITSIAGEWRRRH